jgi:hypothetical protein
MSVDVRNTYLLTASKTKEIYIEEYDGAIQAFF